VRCSRIYPAWFFSTGINARAQKAQSVPVLVIATQESRFR